MSGGITVTGGTGGIAARTADLLLAARLVERLGEEVGAALQHGLPSAWLFGPWDQFAPFGAEVTAEHARVLAPAGAGPTAIARCTQLSRELRAAAARYEDVDRSAADVALGLLAPTATLHAGAAVLGGLVGVLTTGDLIGSAQQVATGDPQLTDAAVLASGLLAVDALVAGSYPDGSPVVTDTGCDPGRVAPHGIADLLANLAVRDEAFDTGGAIDVTVLDGTDGTRRAIVDIPGTKTWDPAESSDITSLATNARALVGEPTSYAAGVLIALRRAGVRPDEPVLLAGHSQGGMVAVEVAAAARRSGEFDVTHVVTAGSPIGRTVDALPTSVNVLALENSTDVVPHLDAAANPATRNVTTVSFRAGDGSIRGDHSLTLSYEYGAGLVDRSRNRSVRDFEDSAAGFFGGGRAIAHTYFVSRRR